MSDAPLTIDQMMLLIPFIMAGAHYTSA